MHQNFIYTDLVDQYLKGKLSKDERLAFEEKIQQDPLLANEVSLQQDIYEALGEARKAALKNRLNQVPIHQSPRAPWQGFKTAAVIGTLLLAGASSYYYVNSLTQSTEATISSTTATTKQVKYPKAYTLSHRSVVSEVEKPSAAPRPAEAETPFPSAASEATTPANVATRTNKPTVANQNIPNPTVVRPEVVSQFAEEDDVSINYDDFNVPAKQALQGNNYQKEDVAIETLSDSDYHFHYQFYDNKLYLYGEFYGLPYKIIALNTEADKKLFLEFKDDYYHIGEHRDIVPLEKIDDDALVKSLNKLSQAD